MRSYESSTPVHLSVSGSEPELENSWPFLPWIQDEMMPSHGTPYRNNTIR